MTDTKPIDEKALDRLSVAPGDPKDAEHSQHPGQDAGRDTSIAKRLERNPESKEAQLDAGLDESMDASDPPAATQPANSKEPPASSGYSEEAERQQDA